MAYAPWAIYFDNKSAISPAPLRNAAPHHGVSGLHSVDLLLRTVQAVLLQFRGNGYPLQGAVESTHPASVRPRRRRGQVTTWRCRGVQILMPCAKGSTQICPGN